MAKNKKKNKEFLSEEGFVPSKQWIAKMKLKAEEKVAYQKKKRKEKKEAKAKYDAKIWAKNKPKRKAGQIAIKKLKAARQAIIDFKETKSTEYGFFEGSDEAHDILKEVVKLKKEVFNFAITKAPKK